MEELYMKRKTDVFLTEKLDGYFRERMDKLIWCRVFPHVPAFVESN